MIQIKSFSTFFTQQPSLKLIYLTIIACTVCLFFLTLSPLLLPLFLPTAFKVTLHPQKKWMA